MIPRIAIPADARLDTNTSQQPGSVRQAHLVPRRLIPANARIEVFPKSDGLIPKSDGAHETPRNLMVRKLLVPDDARLAKEGEAGARPHAARHPVFEEALLGKAALGHRRSAGEWLVSFAVHAAIVAAVLVVPLFVSQTIDPHQFMATYLVAPLPPGAPPPPPPAAGAGAHRPIPNKAVPIPAKLTMPIAIPKTTPKPAENESAEAVPPDIIGGVPGGVAGGVPGGVVGGVLGGQIGGMLGSAGPAAPAAPPPPAAASGPLRVGGAIKRPKLIYQAAPEYPRQARDAWVQGDVEVDAIIDVKGNVVQARALSGPPLLIEAALKAVSGWKYEPTYLNGQPSPVELTVDVTFSLDD